ncbi:Bug family tripartite tricarboxylate transporter substrate binding protein [Siccirubricoccus phaeus]|uniref:Bug family tripartite tricarboxylate transporter substrate binding protein n=1 Tax=Siccirubricoccus phaeus TaxID=2595053 RepID=UPI0011F226C2|nr:tripartite tricarboxylate transporter substrate binding protein [Siccirubricoccus phaeus]
MLRLARRPLLLAAILAAPAVARAQPYPARPVRIIVPFPPGNSTDIVARFIADALSQSWPQRVVVENRSGGAGAVGMDAGARAAGDGYTLVVGSSGTLAVNPAIIPNLSYDVLRDFAPISNLATMPLLLVARPDFPAHTLPELQALARQRPGELGYGSPGPGTAGHMAGEYLAHRAGIRMQHVPYRGTGPALADLLGGTLPLVSDSLASALPHVRDGRLKALVITGRNRAPQLPDVPTAAETLGEFEAVGWIGMVAPVATPGPLVSRINAEVVRILRDPSSSQRLESLGGSPDPGTPAEFAAFIRSETEKWREVARIANVRLDS